MVLSISGWAYIQTNEKMRTIKNYLLLLLATTALLFSACEGIEDAEPENINPFDPPTAADLYLISTHNPDIKSDKVVFKGSLLNADATIAYGFMWYVKPADQQKEPEIFRVLVGDGDINGHFEESMNSLPKGVELIVCAFVDYLTPSQQVVNEIGDYVDFAF